MARRCSAVVARTRSDGIRAQVRVHAAQRLPVRGPHVRRYMAAFFFELYQVTERVAERSPGVPDGATVTKAPRPCVSAGGPRRSSGLPFKFPNDAVGARSPCGGSRWRVGLGPRASKSGQEGTNEQESTDS
jgi:hypothetical protein